MAVTLGASQSRSATSRASPRRRVESRQLSECVARGVERVGRLRVQEVPSIGDDVVHDDDRLLGIVVDRRVVRAWRPDVDLRRELAVEVRLRQQVGPW